MKNKVGIIKEQQNPFSCNDWIKQGFGLTDHRRKQVAPLLGLTIEEIRQIKRNEGRYPAFVAIRWGFAEVQGNRLRPTEKWEHRNSYDKYGN
jgi:hypothetical protein